MKVDKKKTLIVPPEGGIGKKVSWKGKRHLEHEEQVNFRCTKADLDKLDELAAFYGESKAAVLRMMIAREHEFVASARSEGSDAPLSIAAFAKRIAEDVH